MMGTIAQPKVKDERPPWLHCEKCPIDGICLKHIERADDIYIHNLLQLKEDDGMIHVRSYVIDPHWLRGLLV